MDAAQGRDTPAGVVDALPMFRTWWEFWSTRSAEARVRRDAIADALRSEDEKSYTDNLQKFERGARDALGPEYRAAADDLALSRAELSVGPQVQAWLRHQETLRRPVTFDEVNQKALSMAEVRGAYLEVLGAALLIRYAALGPARAPAAPAGNRSTVPVRSAGSKAISGFTAAESEIIHEARTIINAAQFEEIRAAHAAGQSVTVRIGGRLIQYEPGLPASGMTMFGEDGFLIGREAFASSAELGKTVLQELYRLRTSASAAGVSAGLAASETSAAFNFAERGIGAL